MNDFIIQLIIGSIVVLSFLGWSVFISQKLELKSIYTVGYPITLALFSQFFILLALLGLFKYSVVVAILSLGFLFLIYYHSIFVSSVRACYDSFLKNSFLQNACVFLVLYLVLGYFARWLMAQPYGDAEAFYLAYPKMLSISDRLRVMPGTYENFAQIGIVFEILMSTIYKLAPDYSIKPMLYSVAAVLLLQIWSLTRKSGGNFWAGLLVILVTITSGVYNEYIAEGKVELFPSFFAIASFSLLLFSPIISGRILFLSAFLAGVAVVAKFSYLVFLPPTLLLWAWYYRAQLSKIKFLLAVLAFLVPLLIHSLKNYLLFSEPLAPFVLLHSDVKPWTDQVWMSWASTYKMIALYPLALVWGGYPMQGGIVGPYFLLLFPLAWFGVRNINLQQSKKLFIFGAFGLGLWLIVRARVFCPRYYLLPLLFLFSSLSIYFVEYWKQPKILKITKVVMVIALGVFYLFHARIAQAYLSTAKEAFRHARRDYKICLWGTYSCPAQRKLSELAPLGSRVLLSSYFGYNLRPDLLQCKNSSKEGFISFESAYLRGFRYVVFGLYF